jgi:hypothetical protein
LPPLAVEQVNDISDHVESAIFCGVVASEQSERGGVCLV